MILLVICAAVHYDPYLCFVARQYLVVVLIITGAKGNLWRRLWEIDMTHTSKVFDSDGKKEQFMLFIIITRGPLIKLIMFLR